MEVRATRASAVIVQHVPAAAVERFLAWQRDITAVAEGFAGYRGTDLYPPATGQQDEWVAVLHFDNPQALQRWLDSPARADWTSKLHKEIGDFRLKTLPSGFGPWFAGLVGDLDGLPPAWKMALTVLLGLYPTVMLLTIFIGPFTNPLGLAVAMLIGNALSVSLLQWAIMPVLGRLFAPWLKAKAGRATTLGGVVLIVVLLAGLTVLFRLLTS